MIENFKNFYLSFLIDGEENVRKTAIEILPNMIRVIKKKKIQATTLKLKPKQNPFLDFRS
jgi:hypothetical protein